MKLRVSFRSFPWLLIFMAFNGFATQTLAQDNNISTDREWQSSQEDAWQDDAWGDEWETDTWSTEETPWSFNINFIEFALGDRWDHDPVRTTQTTLHEWRLQLETEYSATQWRMFAKVDLLHDQVSDKTHADIREWFIDYSLQDTSTHATQILVGRHVLTWGVSDYLFLNDVFPKDWQAFFNGRDDVYLKAPADVVQVGHYWQQSGIELVWIPRFTPDEFIDGSVFSYFSPLSAQRTQQPFYVPRPHDSEFALRYYTQVEHQEWGVYAHYGREKSPTALRAITDKSAIDENDLFEPYFAPVMSVGASLRQPLAGGLIKAEWAYSRRRDDDTRYAIAAGNTWRTLIGYEREWLPKLVVGWQVFSESQQRIVLTDSPERGFEALSSLPFQVPAQADAMLPLIKRKHEVTLTQSVHYQLWQDTITLHSLFMYSPSRDDGLFKFSLQYRGSDQWQVDLGVNRFFGEKPSSFLGQFELGSNGYIRFRFYME